MKGGVVPELYHGQALVPPSRRIVHRAMEVHIHAPIEVLALAICLRVVHGGVEQFGACPGKQLAIEVAGEDLAAIVDDGGGNAMQLDKDCPRTRVPHVLLETGGTEE